MSDEKRDHSKSLFDHINKAMNVLIDMGEDPCRAACSVSEATKTHFADDTLLHMTPSECLLVWELRVGTGPTA